MVTIGNVSFAGSNEYKAEFVDATGVVKGDDIRVAGVKVGTVKDVEIVDRTRALVTFTVEESTAGDRRDQRRDPLPQPGRPALHHPDPGASATPAGSTRARPSRSPRPRPRST